MDEGALLEALEERGLIEQVMESLNLSKGSEATAQLSPLDGDKRESEGERQMEDEYQQRGAMETLRNMDQCLSSPKGILIKLLFNSKWW